MVYCVLLNLGMPDGVLIYHAKAPLIMVFSCEMWTVKFEDTSAAGSCQQTGLMQAPVSPRAEGLARLEGRPCCSALLALCNCCQGPERHYPFLHDREMEQVLCCPVHKVYPAQLQRALSYLPSKMHFSFRGHAGREGFIAGIRRWYLRARTLCRMQCKASTAGPATGPPVKRAWDRPRAASIAFVSNLLLGSGS